MVVESFGSLNRQITCGGAHFSSGILSMQGLCRKHECKQQLQRAASQLPIYRGHGAMLRSRSHGYALESCWRFLAGWRPSGLGACY